MLFRNSKKKTPAGKGKYDTYTTHMSAESSICRSRLVFLRKGVLKICTKFTEHPFQSEISIKLLCKFIEITLRHGCSSVDLLHIFRTPFLKGTLMHI